MEALITSTVTCNSVDWPKIDLNPKSIANGDKSNSSTTFAASQSIVDISNSQSNLNNSTGIYAFIESLADRSNVKQKAVNEGKSWLSNTFMDDEVQRLTQQRIALITSNLAENAESRELSARLDLLNKRLLRKLPRVTLEQVETLEKDFELVEQIVAKRMQRAEKFQLKK